MKKTIENIKQYVRAANYLSVTQIYLQDNFLLERPLKELDIKPKLFGHWGTCPGINFVYGNLQYFVKKQKQSTMFLLGPGHGFPALQANLFLEKTLEKYYPKASQTKEGIAWVSKIFSWPYGVSSHSNPEAPGLILEGGELGYSLATAYGAILDNPDLLAVCMIGDGEAETGPIAASWHINKLIDPATNGAVLPILHVNGYKISGPTIFGRMSKKELQSLFAGYGYEPIFVGSKIKTIYEDMQKAFIKAHKKIKAIQKKAKKQKIHSPKFPMIILYTPKGWTGIKELGGKQIEGTINAHQVVAPKAGENKEELRAIEKWLQSYKFSELFSVKNGFNKNILSILPQESLRIGNNNHVYAERIYKKLQLPNAKNLEKKLNKPGELVSQSMKTAGEYLREVFVQNQNNFRLMSPDETYSNRLDTVFSVTSRAFVWPHKNSDKHLAFDGRVMEMLSEHNLHGLAQGYILTGRHAVFTTYEAFAQIFSSMTHQYEKFLKVARTLSWRGKMASMNYMLSSTLWRQEHNGFTHQNPSFISGILEKNDCNIHVYFPVDDNSMIATMEEMLSSTNRINAIVAGKTIEPRWVSLPTAQQTIIDAMAIWDFINDENPDIVFAGIGDYVTKEAIAAIEIIKHFVPQIKIRFVNVAKLSGKCQCADNFHPQLPNAEHFFTMNKPVIVNFHGYPETMQSMLVDVINPQRFFVHGYREQGGTTTPFDMMVRNKTDRFHLAIEAIEILANNKLISPQKRKFFVDKLEKQLEYHKAYIMVHGADPKEIEMWEYGKQIATPNKSLLTNAKTIGMIGLSNNPERTSFKVAQYLESEGYTIVPINPKISTVLGKKSYPTVTDVPKNISLDIVTIYRKSEEVMPHVKEVVKRGNVKTIWLPEGVTNTQAEDLAKEAGISSVSNFCIMKVHQQLQNTKGN
ncbi:MAG TPA: phosphoketolase [Patescibacteria group bacterium]